MTAFRRLWTGDVPLDAAFWNWAVVGGIAVNLVTTLVFLVLVSVDRPLAALAVGYGLAVPYNVVATVGVWRSAARAEGDRTRANVYRIVTLIGMAALSFT